MPAVRRMERQLSSFLFAIIAEMTVAVVVVVVVVVVTFEVITISSSAAKEGMENKPPRGAHEGER